MSKDVITKSTITCPECGHSKTETMPTDACLWFYECESCHELLKPKQGDCCVFCSYGDVPCPPIQNTVDELLKDVDSALYQAKQSGRNCVISDSIGDSSI